MIAKTLNGILFVLKTGCTGEDVRPMHTARLLRAGGALAIGLLMKRGSRSGGHY